MRETVHELKIENQFLMDLLDKRKKVEIRKNDRSYHICDLLRFNNPIPNVYPYSYFFIITHIQEGYGLKKGYVALSVERYEPAL